MKRAKEELEKEREIEGIRKGGKAEESRNEQKGQEGREGGRDTRVEGRGEKHESMNGEGS